MGHLERAQTCTEQHRDYPIRTTPMALTVQDKGHHFHCQYEAITHGHSFDPSIGFSGTLMLTDNKSEAGLWQFLATSGPVLPGLALW